MANRKNNAPLGLILIVFGIFAIITFGIICYGAVTPNPNQERCEAAGGFYEIDGGCDFPNR